MRGQQLATHLQRPLRVTAVDATGESLARAALTGRRRYSSVANRSSNGLASTRTPGRTSLAYRSIRRGSPRCCSRAPECCRSRVSCRYCRSSTWGRRDNRPDRSALRNIADWSYTSEAELRADRCHTHSAGRTRCIRCAGKARARARKTRRVAAARSGGSDRPCTRTDSDSSRRWCRCSRHRCRSEETTSPLGRSWLERGNIPWEAARASNS